MSTMKFLNPQHWQLIETHLRTSIGERFAFAFTRVLAEDDATGPVLEVVDVVLIADADTEHDLTGWYVSDRALDRVHNRAVRTGAGLAEFHNHRYGPPRFSPTDERGLAPMARYVLDLIPDRPYAAAVWAEGRIHAEWWHAAGQHRSFDTVTVLGDHLQVLTTWDKPDPGSRFTRQLPLVSEAGQVAIGALRIAVIGAGGTGSQVLTQLAYLGFRHIVVLDDDLVEQTNLNRLVTAGVADIGHAKTETARRRLMDIDPTISIDTRPGLTVAGTHNELHDVDLIIGCLDHDGPRQRLNQIAVDTSTPYLDLATGVDADCSPVAVGGRVALILPGGPCLQCLDELDPAEVARWAKSTDQQQLDRRHGYGTGVANPSVVHLNALTVGAALSELVAWISGSRPPAQWLDVDLTGTSAAPGVRVVPRVLPARSRTCIACGARFAAVS